MNHFSVKRRTATLTVMAAAVTLVACQDKRISQLTVGITRDSAVSVLAQEIKGGGSDSFPNVYDRERFIAGGKSLEVLYFTPNNEKKGRDTVSYSTLTPIVFVDNLLAAKGWSAWDSISKANNIPVRDRSKN